MRDYYLLDDTGKTPGVKYESDPKKLMDWNSKNYGIFWTVNWFNKKGNRKEENISRLFSFYVDIDTGSKESMLMQINKGVKPSCLIETKNGFHAYWYIKEDMISILGKEKALLEYKRINKELLQPFYNSDKNATDAARILRMGNFYHCKNPDDKFLVKIHDENGIKYPWKIFDIKYKPTPLVRKKKAARKNYEFVSDNIWEKIWELDCEDALERLSGSDEVGGDMYEFKQNRSGSLNIYVNGKGTSCWIDTDKKIGSRSGGGPSITQWLRWHNHSYQDVINIIKKYFPEVEDVR